MPGSDPGRTPGPPPRGRGAISNPANRYLRVLTVDDGDEPGSAAEADEVHGLPPRIPTIYYQDDAQSIISENDSPDIPFRYSLNPYRGCQHGCSYCYARPSHEYLGLSPGLDFESKIFVKSQAAALFRDWLNRPRYRCETVVMSGITDCYQPIERQLEITRRCLEVAQEARQPISVITKNALVTRDRDLLSDLAADGLARVAISLTSLDTELTRQLEPRCSVPQARLDAMRAISEAGIPVHVMIAPVIPGLNDSEIPEILKRSAAAGAQAAGFIMLRLPQGVEAVFLEWLRCHQPDAGRRVEQRLRSVRGGSLNSAEFGVRMRGTGPYADQIEALFRVARQRAGLRPSLPPLVTDLFRPPRASSGQRRLF